MADQRVDNVFVLPAKRLLRDLSGFAIRPENLLAARTDDSYVVVDLIRQLAARLGCRKAVIDFRAGLVDVAVQFALAAVAEGDDKVCGLVLLSGAGRPAGTVLREQLSSLPEPLKAEAYAVVGELEGGRTVADPPASLAALFRPSVQPYLISWLALDPAKMAAAYDGPIFIGQGTTDIQISLTDAEAIKAAQPRAELVVWDGVNHVLKTAPAERAANIATYMDPALPLAPGVVEATADFILKPR